MNFFEFLQILKGKKQTIAFVLVIFLLITAVLVVVQSPKYGSVSKVLIIQNKGSETDPYVMSRSNEYLSGILSRVISTSAFYEDVMSSGFNIDRNYFNKDNNEKKEMEAWSQAVRADVIADSGLIEIKVYHKDRGQLEQIARAINYTLQTKHESYHGAGKNVSIKIVDKPLLSNYPVKPNIPFSFILAIVMSVVASLVYVYLFPEEKYGLRFWPRKKIDYVEPVYSDSVSASQEVKNNWESTAEIIERK